MQAARLAVAAGNFAECTRFANEALARGQSSDDAALVGEAALVLGTNLRPAIVDRQLVRALEDALSRLSRDPHADPRAALSRPRAPVGGAAAGDRLQRAGRDGARRDRTRRARWPIRC